MKRLHLTGTRVRISGGFGIVLVLFLAVQLFDLKGQARLGEHFGALQDVANENVRTTELKNVLADVELSIRDHLLREDAESRKQVDARFQAFKAALEAAQQGIADPGRKEAVASIAGSAETYWTAFLAVAGKTERKQYIVNQILDPMGTRLRDRLTAIEKADTSADHKVAALAAAARERMFMTQYLVGRYLTTLTDADGDKAKAAWQSALGGVDDLDKAMTDEALRRQLGLLKAFIPTYSNGLAELQPVAVERTARMADLAKLSTTIRTTVDQLRDNAKASETALATSLSDVLAGNSVLVIASSVVAVVLGALLAVLTVIGMIRPIVALTKSMDALARGDTDHAIPGRDRTDELGAMARSVQVFHDAMVERERLEHAQNEEREARAKRAERLESRIGAFEAAVGGLLDAVSEASQQLDGTAHGVASISEEASRLADEAAAAVEKAAANVRNVADSTEHLNQSITEIAQQSTRSSDMTRSAVDEAARTNTTVEGLSGAAQRIGDIVKLITGIASQTNLLALNATIEAARAGEAGRGFSVVASEVKTLAHQTAGATDDIAQQVSAIQNVSGEAVTAIRGIGTSIATISEFTTAIAATVEEQHAAADTIAQSVRDAAAETDRIATNILAVNQAAQRSGQAAGELLQASNTLTDQSNALRGEIRRFLESIRAA